MAIGLFRCVRSLPIPSVGNFGSGWGSRKFAKSLPGAMAPEPMMFMCIGARYAPFNDAIATYRKLKPEIPEVDETGTAIADEIEFKFSLSL